MTPQEKAKELVDYMWIYSLPNANGSWNNAKQCALKAVGEIINVLAKDINPLVNYWFEVKKEIEKL